MGEAKRRKQLDPNYGKTNRTLKNFIKHFERSLIATGNEALPFICFGNSGNGVEDDDLKQIGDWLQSIEVEREIFINILSTLDPQTNDMKENYAVLKPNSKFECFSSLFPSSEFTDLKDKY